MAQGVAWMARALGIPSTIVVPDNASTAKLAAVERLGGRVVRVPWETWWAAVEADRDQALVELEGVDGYFVHPVRDPPVMAGNGTIGLELAEQLEDIDAVLIPWGGGGLTTGVASALRAVSPNDEGLRVRAGDRCPGGRGDRQRRRTRPGRVHAVLRRRSGIGIAPVGHVGAGTAARDGAFPISLEAVAATVKLLAERGRIVAEGAAALPVAAALAGAAGEGRVVCIVSGGNIDPRRLAEILAGRIPD